MAAPASTAALRPGFLAAGVAVLASLAVSTVLVAIAGAGGSAVDLLRVAARTWLVALGSGLTVDSTSYSLIPVGASLMAVGVVAATAAWMLPEPIDDLGAFVAAMAGSLAVVAAITAALTDTDGLHTSVLRATVGGFVVGGAGAWCGATMRHRQFGGWVSAVSVQGQIVIRSAWAGIVTLLGAASLIVLALLILHLERASDLWASLAPGFGGGLVLALGCLAVLPTLVLWAASALIGPGFALGTGTSVDLTGSQLGAVPGLPILAALPAPGAFPDWVFLLGLIPLAAGIVAGVKTRSEPAVDWLERLALGAAAGAAAGFVVGVLIAFSRGAVGPGRMAEAGPPLVTPLLVATLVMGMGGALGAMADHYRGRRASEPSDPTESSRSPRFWRRNQPSSPDRRDS